MKNSAYETYEKERVKALQRLDILDTAEETVYNDIVELASQVCELPIVMINLIDEKRQWTKAKKGIKGQEIPRSLSFCSQAILSDESTSIKDVRDDERFSNFPYVISEPFIRSYTSVPLSTEEGYRIGTLAVFGQQPTKLRLSQLSGLKKLARQIMNLLEMRATIKKQQIDKVSLEQKYQALLENEGVSKAPRVLEHIDNALINIDKNGLITEFNEPAEELFNINSKNLPDQYIWDVIPKESGIKLFQLSQEAISNQKVISHQIYDDLKRYCFVAQIYPSTNGSSIYFTKINASKVVTQNQNTDKYFSDSIINGLPGIFYLFDTNLKFLRWNDNFQSISGYSSDEIEQMNPLDFFDIEDKSRIENAIQNVFVTGSADIEANFLSKSGKKIPHYFTGTLETFEGTSCLLGLGVDITAKKEAEQKYRNIFEHSLEGIYQSTPEGKFITANPAMAKILGYNDAEELIASMTDIESQLYKNPQDRINLLTLLKRKNQVNGFELPVRKKNGTSIWININIRAVHDEDGKISHFEGLVEDITKRKGAEKKLKQQFEELQKTNFELDKFVYSVSHDLRAPLASVLGLVNIAQLENLSSSQNQYWEMTRGSIMKMEGFIKDILDYSNNSRREIKAERIDFNKIMKEVQENFSFLTGAERLTIKIEIDEKIAFYSDETRIKIILNNLFSNAIKYQDNNKKTSYFILEVETTALNAHIRVKDNGIGIDNVHINKVFNMFYRASNTSKGSGLGLYITNETILKLDGKIEVKSELHEGTTFNIHIPSLRTLNS